jgi:cell division protein FtsB
MKEFQERRRRQKRIYSKTSIVFMIFVVIVMARATWGVYLKEKESRVNMLLASSSLAELQARHDLLSNEVGRLQTPEGQDEAIRDKYQVAKPGEQEVVIVDATSTVAPPDVGQGVLQKMWNSIVHIFKK